MSVSERPVLLVENEANDVLLMERAYRKAGFLNPLITLSDGQEAFEFLCREERSDRRGLLPLFIISDLNMPRKNGWELAEALKGNSVLRRIPILILSSSCSREEIGRCYDAGANMFLNRPTELGDLTRLFEGIRQIWAEASVIPDVEISWSRAASP
jgi:CheY-like chemotaxis protein